MGWWRLGRPGVAVILRLVAEGRLALSDTLERRLPGILPTATRSVSASCSITPAGWPTARPPSNRRCTRPAGTPPRLDPTGADRPGGCRPTTPASPARHLAATACPAAPAGTRSTARCWISPSRTPRTPGRPAGCCHPGLLAEMRTTVAVPHGSIPLPLYDRHGLGLWRSRRPPGAWSATPAVRPLVLEPGRALVTGERASRRARPTPLDLRLRLYQRTAEVAHAPSA